MPGLRWEMIRVLLVRETGLYGDKWCPFLGSSFPLGLWLLANAGSVWFQRASGFEKGMMGQILIQFNLNKLRAHS